MKSKISGLFLIQMNSVSSLRFDGNLSAKALTIDWFTSLFQTMLQLISPSRYEGYSYYDKTKVIITFSPGLSIPF